MKRWLVAAMAGVAVLSLLVMGTAEAAGPGRPGPKVGIGAVAMGQLDKDGGGSCRLRLMAGALAEDGHVRGVLRLGCPDEGIYVARVKTLTAADGTATLSGEGARRKADGTRVHLAFTATISANGKQVTIHLTGDGVDETITGHLDPGIVRAGARPLREAKP
jgi:hypothetical protein